MTIEYTTLGLRKVGPSQDLGTDFTYNDRDTIDRLFRLVMNHRHNGETGISIPTPAPPTVTPQATAGLLMAGTTYYYRVSTVDTAGVESAASLSTPVMVPGGVDMPDQPNVTSTPTGGTLPSGIYQYAVTAWVGSWTQDTTALPVTVNLPYGSDTHTVSVGFPTLPANADGFNVYRRFPGSTLFTWQATFTGPQGSPWVDSSLTDPGTYRTLPTQDLSGYRKSTTISAPSGASKWRIYRSRDDNDWQGSFVAESTLASFTDTGQGATYGAPPPNSVPYQNPQKISPSDVASTPAVWTSTMGGAPTVDTMAEWVCPYPTAQISGATISVDAAAPPGGSGVEATVEQWDGSTWAAILDAAIPAADTSATVDASAASGDVNVTAGDRMRVNVTQVGSAGANLSVQVHMWVDTNGTGWSEFV